MPRSRLTRVTAALLALLTSVSSPLMAVGHGLTHAHVAEAHDAADATHHVAAPAEVAHHDPEFELPAHEHAHGHQVVDAAASGRIDVRLGGAALAPITEPIAHPTAARFRWIDVAPPRDRTPLARAGPAPGAPSRPRAPPVR